MAALTAPLDVKSKVGDLLAYPVAANTIIFKGALVEIVAGFAQPAADTAGAAFAGVSYETVANVAATPLPGGAGFAGAAGALSVRVLKHGAFLYAKTSAVRADVGQLVHVVDDNTVTTAGTTNNIPAGYVVELVDSAHVRVRIDRSVQ